MKGRVLHLVFKQDKAFLGTECELSFEQLGLSNTTKTYENIPASYWTIRVIRYDEEEGKLFCEVLEYKIGAIDFSPSQLSINHILKRIRRITFKNIDTAGLLKTLDKKNSKSPTYAGGHLSPVLAGYTVNDETKPITRIIRESFSVPLKHVKFKLGGVSFEKKIKELNKSIEITIINYSIREEFDAVKNYFANVLKSKRIHVELKIEAVDGEVIILNAYSPDIEKIDEKFIDEVKFNFVRSIKKKKLTLDIDKSLFTMDQYFDTFSDEKFKSNTFHSNDKELFEDMLHISSTKHYKHLRYLSSIHDENIMKLRFVHKPFSFIFLVNGDKRFHIIWETLDTEEATYVWHIPKEIPTLKMTLGKIEEIINVIKVEGKTAYINSTEDSFRRIYHDYSHFVDGFQKWKAELESFLN